MSLASKIPGSASTIKGLQTLLNKTISASLRSHEAHWNVKGEDFGQLHALFGDVYDFLNDLGDLLAERIVQLDGTALAQPSGSPLTGDASALLAATQKSLEDLGLDFIQAIESTSKDPSTNNMLMNELQSMEKLIWKLQASADKKRVPFALK